MSKINAAKEAGKKAYQGFIVWIMDEKNRPLIFFYLLIIIACLGLLRFYNYKYGLKFVNDQKIKLTYGKGTSIGPITTSHTYYLRDYFILGSYNSCCGGMIVNDFVSLVPLQEVIKQGARVLDFELYSKNGSPIVAASPETEPDEKIILKGSYNHIELDELFNTIETYGFGSGLAPNPTDPLFLNFRIKTENVNVLNTLAKKLHQKFSKRLLAANYGNEGQYASKTHNMQTVKLLDIKKKVIIMVQDPKKTYRNSELVELVNLSTEMPNFRVLTNHDIMFGHDMAELAEANKKGITLTVPDAVADGKNGNIQNHRKYGCQMCLTNFSILDNFHNFNLKAHNDQGTAFILKPPPLRYQEKKIAPPKDQNPNVSYKEKPFKTDVVSFKL